MLICYVIVMYLVLLLFCHVAACLYGETVFNKIPRNQISSLCLPTGSSCQGQDQGCGKDQLNWLSSFILVRPDVLLLDRTRLVDPNRIRTPDARRVGQRSIG